MSNAEKLKALKLTIDKIDKDFGAPLIHTVRGVGYRFSENE